MVNQLKKISFIDPDKAFTAGVAHDLNNLLSAIKGRTVLMMNSVHPSDPLQKHFNEIITCIDKSIDTTELLLNSNRVDEGFERSE